jgi:hypothetical protein
LLQLPYTQQEYLWFGQKVSVTFFEVFVLAI